MMMIHSNEYVMLCLPLYKFLMHLNTTICGDVGLDYGQIHYLCD